MTKTELVTYLERLKERAVEKVIEERDAKCRAILLDYVNNLDINFEISKVQKLLESASEMLRRAELNIVIPDQKWKTSMNRTLADLISNTFDVETYIRTYHEIDEIEGYQDLVNFTEKSKNEIRKNYKNLILNVKALKTAKQGVEYLQGLGFVIDIKTQPEANLAVPVDPRFLICKGE